MRATFLQSLLLTAAVALTSSAGAAIVVGPGPGGSGLQTFGTLPGVTEWSTHSVAGGAGDILDTTAFGTAIQLLNANIITNVLGSSATVPPSQTGSPAGIRSTFRVCQEISVASFPGRG